MNEIIAVNAGITPAQTLDADFLTRWENFIDVSPKSKDTYKKGVKSFLTYMQRNGITAPTREDVIAWRDETKATRKATTVQTYLIAVKLFFSWLEQEGLYKNVADHIKGVRIEKAFKKDYLTSKQSKKVLAAVDTASMKGKRDFAIIALMLTTGVRTIEVINADIADIRTVGDNVALFLKGKKTDEKASFVKLAPQVEDAIRIYITERGETDEAAPLFASTSNQNSGGRMTTRSIRGIVKDTLIKAGFKSDRLTAHSMRHTAGTLALLNGAELAEVQQLLRHTNINTTMIYQHGIDRAKNNSELKVANAIF